MRSILTLVVCALVTACGGTGATPAPTQDAAATRIEVAMNDSMRFVPDSMTVPANVPITFVVTNVGQIEHEMYLGPADAQEEHEQEMMEPGEMPHQHNNSIVLGPGESGELVYTFRSAGEWLAGCHVPGHWPAGMKATITVI